MKSTPRIARTVAAAAMTGLIAGSGAMLVGCQHDDSQSAGVRSDRTPAAHDCKGQNNCKGQGGCKTGNNGCKGQNSCKDQGGCKVAA